MINLRNRIAGLAGLLVLTGATAFAQSEIKLDVPFAFHTPNATLAAGAYSIVQVDAAAASGVYRLRNAETGKTVLLFAPARVERKLSDTSGAKVEFKCAGEDCALSAIYTRSAEAGRSVPVKMKKSPAGEQVASIVIPARH